ncbi:MAG TPA: serine/threonine-protein kinase [Polyangiaceae bacterium]|nr:serine/threonine-protein kinase [Polyangiaceae bacterium]
MQIEGRFCPQCGASALPPSVAPTVSAGAELDLGWGKVVVGDVVGEGGMGVVRRGWLYYNPRGTQAGTPAHPVAVKVLNPLLRGRARARQLFLGEAEALRRLSHPNIVHFFGLVQDAEQLALVIELVDGQALNQVIGWHVVQAQAQRAPCLPFMRAWHYFSQLLGALAAIHALGIIHRDVKPSNVLIRRDDVVKLTDFGIARVPQDEVRNTGGMAPGTGAYMAPEQVLGRDIDPRADLYGAAIVLYEMLAGVTPFDSAERNEIMVRTAQVEETPPPLTRLVPAAPAVLDVLMARALAKDPMHRFASAIDMGEAFRSALGLSESAGWTAQQRLAEQAQAISQMGLASGRTSPVAATQAEKLRTAIMLAYKA